MSLNSSRSQIWRYYTIQDSSDEYAKCSLCGKQIKRGSNKRSFSTTPLWNHFKYTHQNGHLQFRVKETGGNGENVVLHSMETNKMIEGNQLQANEEEEDVIQVKQEQLTFHENYDLVWEENDDDKRDAVLSDNEDTHAVWDLNDPRSKKIHENIMKMIALDNKSLETTEDNGFIELIAFLQPQYKMPSCEYFSNNVLPETYKIIRSKIESRMEPLNALYISFTSNTWRCTVTEQIFISFSAHWIDKDFKRNDAFLEISSIPLSCATFNIASTIEKMWTDWKIEKSRRHLFVRDWTANMATIGANLLDSLLDTELVHCTLHLLELVVAEFMESQKSILDLLEKLRKIAEHFICLESARTELKNLQIEVNPNGQLLLPIKDTATNWSSSYQMVKRMVKLKRPIQLYLLDTNNLPSISLDEWKLCNNFLYILQPFWDFSQEMSGEKSNLSAVLPNIVTLELFLSNIVQNDASIQSMREELLNSLRMRFFNASPTHRDIQKRYLNLVNNKTYVTATLLDPRFKRSFFKNDIDSQQAIAWLLDEVIKLDMKCETISEYNNSFSGMSSEFQDHQLVLPLKKKVKKSHHTGGGGGKEEEEVEGVSKSRFQEVVACGTSFQGNEGGCTTPTRFLAINELQNYLKLPLLNKRSDPLEWWRNDRDFPLLRNLSRKFLSTPASGRCCYERLSSNFGKTFEEKRKNIFSSTNKKLTFIQQNIQNDLD